VEAFRLDEGFVVRGYPEGEGNPNELYFEVDPDWRPEEDEEDRDLEGRAELVHEAINYYSMNNRGIEDMGDALALVLYSHPSLLEAAERDGSAPVRRQGTLSRRIIADVAFDMLNCWRALHRAPGPSLLKLLERLLGVEERRLNSDRRYKARRAAIAIDAERPNLSTRQLASLVGVNPATIARWRKEPGYIAEVEERRKLQQSKAPAAVGDTAA
jgi:hypothetical protein